MIDVYLLKTKLCDDFSMFRGQQCKNRGCDGEVIFLQFPLNEKEAAEILTWFFKWCLLIPMYKASQEMSLYQTRVISQNHPNIIMDYLLINILIISLYKWLTKGKPLVNLLKEKLLSKTCNQGSPQSSPSYWRDEEATLLLTCHCCTPQNPLLWKTTDLHLCASSIPMSCK